MIIANALISRCSFVANSLLLGCYFCSLFGERLRTVLLVFIAPLIVALLVSIIIIAMAKSEGDPIFTIDETEGWLYILVFPPLLSTYSSIVVYQYIGISGITICSTAGQLVMSLVMDQVGLLGFEVKEATAMRICGVVLVCVAAISLQFAKRDVEKQAVARKVPVSFDTEQAKDDERQGLLSRAPQSAVIGLESRREPSSPDDNEATSLLTTQSSTNRSSYQQQSAV